MNKKLKYIISLFFPIFICTTGFNIRAEEIIDIEEKNKKCAQLLTILKKAVSLEFEMIQNNCYQEDKTLFDNFQKERHLPEIEEWNICKILDKSNKELWGHGLYLLENSQPITGYRKYDTFIPILSALAANILDSFNPRAANVIRQYLLLSNKLNNNIIKPLPYILQITELYRNFLQA